MRGARTIAFLAALAAGLGLLAPAGAAELSADFLAGMEALEAGRNEEARAALERAVAADPANGRALLLLGICELELGEAEAALAHLAAARAADPSLESLARAHEDLARRRAPRRRFQLSTRVGLEFDDNVSVPELDATSERADGAFLAELQGSYRLLDTERAAIEAGYGFSQSLHFDLSDADLQAHDLWLDGSHALGSLDAGLGYRFGTSTLGGDGFLHLHELRPRLLVPVRAGWSAELAAAYRHKDFLDSQDRDRDAHGWSAGVQNFFQLADGRARLDAGARFEGEDARGAEFDHLGFSLGTGLRVPFEWRGEWAFDLAWRLRLRDYAHTTPSIGEARLDLENGVGVGLMRRLTQRIEAKLDYRFTAADSNLPSADYLGNRVALTFRTSL